jgi:HD-GYP domain-containing protein (c-di-GMP phosphodiesterase class II)
MRSRANQSHRENTPSTVAAVTADVTLPEVAALLAVAQDYAFGQTPGSQLRATVLADNLAMAAGADARDRATTWWAATLRYLGCTGHAFETAVLFGDEIELRAESLRADFSNPIEMLRMMLSHAGPGESAVGRLRAQAAVVAGGRKAAVSNFRAACEVADAFALRLGLDDATRAAIGASFERWNGRGLPSGLKGTAIPRPMRFVQLAQELEVLARVDGVATAVETIERRRGKAYEPALVDIVSGEGPQWCKALDLSDPWDEALAVAPECQPLDDAAAHDVLLVLGDFADLKSPWTNGHSRAVAALARDAGGPVAEAAALVHDLGCVAVPNTIWDKDGPLTRDERDRAETHALVADQLLRRVPYFAAFADAAAAAHERVDGSGYHRRCTASQLDDAARVVATADCYQAMTADRPYRRALTADDAATELRAMAAERQLDANAVERVLEAAGHRRRSARASFPAGLTDREADVLRLLALGLTTKQVAERLVISAKTADHHVQHIYTKIGVSTRGAAALFAIEQGILPTDS